MPIRLSCPECEKTLNIDDRFAGRRVKCPKCQAAISVPDEEDERPAPRKRSRTDEDEQPRARTSPRRRDEDEEDERPSKRSSRAADTDESFDFGRDDPGPRKSKKKQKKGSGMLLWLGLGGGAVLLLGTVVCAGVLYLVVGGGGGLFGIGGPRLTTEMKYLPDNCLLVTTERVDQMRKTRFHEARKEKLKALKSNGNLHGIKEEDVERVTTANVLFGGVSIITTNKAIKAEDVKTALERPLKDLGGAGLKVGFAEEKVGSYVLYKMEGALTSQAFCVPESKIVLVGAADELRKILQRDKKPDFSENFQRAWSDADFSATRVVITATIMGGKVGGGKMAGTQLADATLMQVDHGTTVKLKTVSYYKDADAAEQGRKQAVEKFEKGKVALLGLAATSNQELKQNASISRSGSKVILTSHVKEQSLIDDLNRR